MKKIQKNEKGKIKNEPDKEPIKKQKKEKSVLRTLKLVSPGHIIILILLIAFNSFAWFVFNSKVSTGMNVHVSAWNIEFSVDKQTIEEDFTFDITNAQPGMDDFIKTITVRNKSAVTAEISYEIKEVDIMNEKRIVSDTTKTQDTNTTSSDTNTYTSAELENDLANNYPFKITFSFVNDSSTIETNQEGGLSLTMKWALDSGNDELDTEWGEKAYNFSQTNPDDAMIHILVKVKVEQKE